MATVVAGAARAGVIAWQQRRLLAWLLALLLAVPLGLALIVLVVVSGTGVTTAGPGQYEPSARALRDIPSLYLRAYQAAGTRYEIDWTYLAAIGKIETDHGRSTAAGVRSGVNSVGCCAGPMQFSITGAAGGTWGAYGVDGDGDATKDVYDPADAIPGAANYLKASPATGTRRSSPTTTPAGTSPTSNAKPRCTAATRSLAAPAATSPARAAPTPQRSRATPTSRSPIPAPSSRTCAPAGSRHGWSRCCR
jgi:hypothetical protein